MVSDKNGPFTGFGAFKPFEFSVKGSVGYGKV